MTQIHHHLSDDLLLAYATGSLSEAFNLLIATHVSICDDCRAALGALDAVGGAVLEGEAPVAVSDDAFDRTLERLGDETTDPVRRQVPTREDMVFPSPLQAYVGGDLDAVRWRAVGGGVRQSILPTARGATVRLLRIPAGQAVPDHGHSGLELTLVLQGAFRDADGRFARGDVEIAGPDVEHTPVAEAGEDCICLAATDARLRFTGLLPRLAQPFFQI